MRNVLLAAAALCGLGSGVQAATITVSAPISGLDPYYTQGDILLSAFDTSLGTLTSITVHAQEFLSEQVLVQSNGPLPVRGAFSTVSEYWVVGTTPNISYAAPVQNLLVPLTPVPTSGGLYDPRGSGVAQASFNDTFTLPASSVLTEGQPTDIRYAVYVRPGSGLGFVYDGSYSATAGGLLSLAYNYTEAPGTTVPEPASMALLGFGGLAAVLWRRKHTL